MVFTIRRVFHSILVKYRFYFYVQQKYQQQGGGYTLVSQRRKRFHQPILSGKQVNTFSISFQIQFLKSIGKFLRFKTYTRKIERKNCAGYF